MEPIVDYVHLRGSLRIAMLDPNGKILEERMVKKNMRNEVENEIMLSFRLIF